MKNNKVLYIQNQSRINGVKKNLSYSQKLIQTAVTEFQKIDISISLIELQGLLGSHRRVDKEKTEEFIKSKLVEGKENSVKGLRLNPESLKDLIVLPDLTAIMEVLEEFKKPIDSETIFDADVIYWEHYFIDKNNEVQITADAVEVLTQSFNMYAETKEEKKRLKDVLKLCDALTVFCASHPELQPIEIVNSKLIEFGNNNEFLPSPHFINTGKI